MEYVWYFLSILWYTLGAVILCGLLAAWCQRMFQYLLGDGMGRGLFLGTSIVGTPVHELGHALMCLLFGHKIQEMSLWNPRAKNGDIGYVRHSYNPRNPYHQLGNLFIGIGPILSGLGVTAILLMLCFPHTWSTYVDVASDMVSDGRNPLFILWAGIRIWPGVLFENSVAIWWKILAILLMLAVSLHVMLSPADIKNSLRAVPVYLVIVLLFTVITALLGHAVMSSVQAALATYQAVTVALFSIVLSCSVVLVLLAMVVWLLCSLFRFIFHK